MDQVSLCVRSGSTVGRIAALTVLAVATLLVLAPRAGADLIYWDNYEGESVSFANSDGSGGGLLNIGGNAIDSPEGMAYDTVTNRLFLANEGAVPPDGEILAINLDGSGASLFTAPGAPIDDPQGIAVDPVARTIYWYNSGDDTIAWARLDGSGGGVLSKAGATEGSSRRLAIDAAAGRLYFGREGVSFVNLDNSGGGDLNLAGATAPEDITGYSVDPNSGRLYWIDNEGVRVSSAALGGGFGQDLAVGGAIFDSPYGLALDPSIGRVYWANYGTGAERIGAFGFANLAGGGGGINIATAPIDGPQDPLIIKNPSAIAAPQLARAANSREWLACSQGEWGQDYPGSFVYRAPRSYAYGWTRDGAPIPGATQAAHQATEPGSYGCAVTATNQAGSTVAASGALSVAGAKLKVLVKTKVKKAKRKKKATFRVQYYNQGDIKSAKPRVCVIVPKKLRKLLKAPKCKKLGRVTGKGRRATKLRVYVKPKAKNKSYKLKFVVKGVPSKRSFGRLRVLGKG